MAQPARKAQFEAEEQARFHEEQLERERESAERREALTKKVRGVIWLVLLAIEALVGLRVGLKALAANPESGFVSFVNAIAGPFLAPFSGLVGDRAVGDGVLEIASLVAMAVYFLLGLGAVLLVGILLSPSRVIHHEHEGGVHHH